MSDVVFIEVRYADGTGERAEGDQAERIWKWLRNAQALYVVHGATYRGPQFTEFKWSETEIRDELRKLNKPEGKQ